ncbi:MAG: GTA-gp10 family protein [Rhizomicrobium sp.]
MTNTTRGDSMLKAGGKSLVMRLTLGALSEIEDGLGNGGGLGGIAGRLESLGSKDIALVASALLKGGGTNVSPQEVMHLETDVGTLVGAITGAFQAAGGARPAANDGGSAMGAAAGTATGTTTGPLPAQPASTPANAPASAAPAPSTGPASSSSASA